MRRKIALVLLFTFLPSCFNFNTSHKKGKKQSEVLYNFYLSKQKENTNVDKRHFDVSFGFDEAEVHPQEGTREKDRIGKLPGQPPVRFSQYGGYVTVNRTAGRAFYYYFVEANNSSKSLPLLLWLNGGPGCSSVGYGAMEELGPFRVGSDGKTLIRNHFSWNHVANVLFVESPAGVGFSYSNTSSDLSRNGDRRTAKENYVFLVNWLERFPEYKNRDFYICGESYAGHYVPQLAHTIRYHNHNSNRTNINLKGIIIGNPTINDETDAKGMYEYYESHGLISKETLSRILRHCDFIGNSSSSSGGGGISTKCLLGILESQRAIAALDVYNIYAPICSNTCPTKQWTDIDPCIEKYVHTYLNNPEVQEALHANITRIPYDWQPCSRVIREWRDSSLSVIPLLQDFIATGLRVWIYSGDVDGRIPVTSTKLSIQLMKLNHTTPWLPWYLHDEIGGYTQTYEGNFTFATVRGAGHQVPSYQPARALLLIDHFLSGIDLPTTTNLSLF